MSEPSVPVQGRILLIDDDELVAGSLREYLVRGGSQVDVAVESSSAERLMREQTYDVVVVDPYLTGGVHSGDDHALLASIRGLQPEAALIVLTAYASPELAGIAGREKAMAILTKPQPIVSLSELVTNASRHAAPLIKG